MAVNLVVGTNTYLSLADAQSYFDARLFADTWASATADQQSQALVMATRAIDRQVITGAKKTDEQLLQFPRRYTYKIHDIWQKWFTDNIVDTFETLYIEGATWWAETDVPQEVKDATCEEALATLMFYNSPRFKAQRQGVKEMYVGAVREMYEPATFGRGLLSIEARELLRRYMAGGVAII